MKVFSLLPPILTLALPLAALGVPARAESLFRDRIPTAPANSGPAGRSATPPSLSYASNATPFKIERSAGGISLQYRFKSLSDLDRFRWKVEGIPSEALVANDNEGRQVNAEDGSYLMVAGVPEMESDGSPVRQYLRDGNVAWAIPETTSFPTTVTAHFGWQLIESVRRETWNGDARYIIKPTTWGRTAPSATHAGWGWPEAQRKGVDRPTKGLHEQYVCHPASQAARVKSTWNIERARPTVGLARTIAARCNPGGGND